MRKFLIYFLIVFIGVALGTGGTIAMQKFVFKSDPSETVVVLETRKDGPLVSIGEFTVNLQGGSFLKTEIMVEGLNEKAKEVITQKEAFLKDRVYTVLGSKTLTDIMTPAAREKVRTELLNELNTIAGDRIYQVLFVSFVYQ